ncbi:MAG: amidohydrolase [Acidimicrobiales bacterium]
MTAPEATSGAQSQLINGALEDLAEKLVVFRRDLHAHPELAWNEVRTSTRVGDELTRAGLSPTLVAGGTGVVCDVEGRLEGPLVALRADLDALAIHDEKAVPYRSRTPGVTHACGHDVHTAVVLGAGLVLARLALAGELPGRVRLLFQPAEEVLPGGALALLAAGALEGVDRVFALHCDPGIDAGSVAVREGPITGATDSVTVRLSGPGGHTARPQFTVDLVTALADVLVRTPALLARRVDPRAGLSLVWGRVTAGAAANVIPESGEASGSVRVLDRAVWESAGELIAQLIHEVAAPYRAQVVVDYVRGVPPAMNDPASTEAFRSSTAALLGPGAVLEAPQSMGGEDFAWILDRVPGVLGRLGVRRPGTIVAPDLHRGDFDVDESAIACGARILVAAAMSALRDPALLR